MLAISVARGDPAVRIAGLGNLTGSVILSAPSNLVMRDTVCITATEGPGQYRVALDAGGGFVLSGPGNGTLPFSVLWDDRRGGQERATGPGVVGVFKLSADSCGQDAFSAAYEVEIKRSDILAAVAGSYGGGLEITISVP